MLVDGLNQVGWGFEHRITVLITIATGRGWWWMSWQVDLSVLPSTFYTASWSYFHTQWQLSWWHFSKSLLLRLTAGREWFKFYTASPNLSDLSIYWHDRAVWAELCWKQEGMHDAQKPIDPSLRLVILIMLDILLNIMHDAQKPIDPDQYEIEMMTAVLTKKLHNVLFHQQHYELIMS